LLNAFQENFTTKFSFRCQRLRATEKKKGGGNMRIRGFLPEFHFSELEFVVRVELSTDKAQGGRHDLEENWFLFFFN
jgi:hypothetical protein